MIRKILKSAVFVAMLCGLLSLDAPGWIFGGMPKIQAENPLITDGDFESNADGQQLRAKEKWGWCESRRNGNGRMLLKCSKKKVFGNATTKAMIKGDPEYNTYMTQRLGESQTGEFALQWDICVREILPQYNRSAFQIIGDASAKGKGPNAVGKERFVFLGFENAETPGKINLVAFEGGKEWDKKTLVAPGLDLKTWYTVSVKVDVSKKRYTVSVPGVMDTPVEMEAYKVKKGPPKKLTHISFASWNDGPGTFYIDNVRQP
ncbi:MAG: hypothetical protein KJ970_08260 [Candidatus Eisenbacteria bacterium]|uniref:Uncharacterized protein n=1 Tax=Eiseniibacteriota bacterium TaxID=2212470 RepID=A0A948W3B6_UNCEI|nr:hypothetical protein [Candidatus Eisenbacteria bacterium]MBU1950984.1 hypothetical protein [Candidatus Eisenbacteria bacterium]MBU2690907.1 hypothetical protein [Candidatus Eisenbacteria bacterium]